MAMYYAFSAMLRLEQKRWMKSPGIFLQKPQDMMGAVAVGG